MIRMIEEKLGITGTMISGSKSGYRNAYPRNVAIFNANLIVGGKKVWHGDIDVTLKRNTLREMAVELEEDVVVLYEMDGRFENESKPLTDRFVYKANSNGTEEIGERVKEYVEVGETIQWKENL